MMDFRRFADTPKKMWITIAVIEILYVVVARTVEYFYGIYNYEAEIYRCVDRIVIFTAVFVIFRSMIFGVKPELKSVKSPLWMFAILPFVSAPLLEGYMGGLDQNFKLFFGATSLFVALHEEIVYRCVIQRLLLKRFSTAKAVLLTSFIFTVYHIGTIDFYINLYIQIFIASIILGVIYIKTNSFGLVVILHTVYDFMPSFTPLDVKGPIVAYQQATYIMLISLAGVLFWAYRADLKNINLLGTGK